MAWDYLLRVDDVVVASKSIFYDEGNESSQREIVFETPFDESTKPNIGLSVETEGSSFTTVWGITNRGFSLSSSGNPNGSSIRSLTYIVQGKMTASGGGG